MNPHPLSPQRLTVTLALALGLLAPAAASAHGILVPTDRTLPPLALKHQRVTIDVTGGAAVTKVEQVFVNSTSRMLEATYLFPTPEGAVITDFRLMMNGKMVRGEVLARDKAEQIYTDIVRRMKDPGLLDWMKPNLLRARIFPVPANGEQKVEITYGQALPFLDGTYKLTYPLKTPNQALRTLQDFTLTVNLDHPQPLKTIYSPSHRVSIGRKGETKAIIGFEGESVTLDSDFTLYFGVSKKDVGLNVLTHRVPGEPGYFMLMAAPKAVFDTDEIQGKAVTFVLDTSGSMSGVKIEHAKKALLWTLDRLGSDDRFNVVRFSSDVEELSSDLLVASKANVAKAKAFVAGFEAAGGTAIDEALATALKAKVRGTRHMVVFLTDGRPTIGETDPAKILAGAARANGDKARIFPFGIGDEINTHLLDRLAQAHGGTSAYVKPNEAIETHVAAFYNQVAFPVLTDLKLDMAGAKPFAMLPGALTDLFRGSQLVIVGRYRTAGEHLVRLEGHMGDAARRFDYEARFPADNRDNAFVAKIWAHRQVGFLLDQVRLSGETAELKAEIVQLATRYGIVTPYTSYLVVEDEPIGVRPPPRPFPRPEPRPRPRRLFKGSGGGFGGPPAGSAPASAQAEEREADIRDTAKDKKALSQEGGRVGVQTAKTVKNLKEKRDATSDVATVKHAGGRVFTWRGSRWVDAAYKPGLTPLEIAPYSKAWLQLAAKSADLKAALALGEAVIIVVGKTAIIVREGGKTELTDAELRALK
jgi:Ca-activated chloride channel family protein